MLAGRILVLRVVLQILIGNLRLHRVVWVRVRQQRTQTQQQLGKCENWRPVRRGQSVHANASVLSADVRVVDACHELHAGRLEWVLLREGDVEFELSILVRRIRRTLESGRPVEQVSVADRGGSAVAWLVGFEALELALDPAKGHSSFALKL